MPTDAELRTLFRGAPGGESTIDTAAVIRRSRRRRLPQQLGAGSVLTLAAAGIGVAGVTGLQGFAPRTASDLAGDAPTAVSEGAPFAGADSGAAENAPACSVGTQDDAVVAEGLSLTTSIAGVVSAGHPVSGSLTLTNTSAEAISGTVVDAEVGIGAEKATTQWQVDSTAAGTKVQLAGGESVTLTFSFDAIDCSGGAAPLEPGEYLVSAVLNLAPDGAEPMPVRGSAGSGAARAVGAEASVIAVR